MADPASIFSVIAGAAGLVSQCGKLARGLHNIAEQYKNADLTVTSMSTGLETIKWAWSRIHTILEAWSDDMHSSPENFDTDTISRIEMSLRGGRMVLSALEEDLQTFDRIPVASGGSSIKSTGPQPSVRKQKLSENAPILQKSDESAFSIVPSRLSISVRDDESIQSIQSIDSEKSLVYQELSIDPDLFTARVYQRNFRKLMLRNSRRQLELQPSESYVLGELLKDDDTASEETFLGPSRSDGPIFDPRIHRSLQPHPELHLGKKKPQRTSRRSYQAVAETASAQAQYGGSGTFIASSPHDFDPRVRGTGMNDFEWSRIEEITESLSRESSSDQTGRVLPVHVGSPKPTTVISTPNLDEEQPSGALLDQREHYYQADQDPEVFEEKAIRTAIIKGTMRDSLPSDPLPRPKSVILHTSRLTNPRWEVGRDQKLTVAGPWCTRALATQLYSRGDIRYSMYRSVIILQEIINDYALFRRVLLEGKGICAAWLGHCLMIACWKGLLENVELLLDQSDRLGCLVSGLRVAEFYAAVSPLELAYRYGHHDVVRLLLTVPNVLLYYHYNLDTELVSTAIDRDDSKMLEALVTIHGFDINYPYDRRGTQSIQLAHYRKASKCIKFLDDIEADMASKENHIDATCPDHEKRIAKVTEQLSALREQTERLSSIYASADKMDLGPLVADLFLAFAEKAIVLLSKSNPSLVPAILDNDQSRLQMLADFVASIPENMYEDWGLPGYENLMRDAFLAITSVKPPRWYPYDKYEFARMMVDRYRPHPERRRTLEPLFMFVHGKNFDEMFAESPPPDSYCPFRLLGVSMFRHPWSPEQAKQTWKEPVRRGRRSGGRKGQ
ncbi:MAG: hypothetical protein Q9170_003457 [Blastenia crenularia]